MRNLFDAKLPSVMKHDFSKVPSADISRSSFKRSHGHKTAFDEGYLIPIFVDEALPGDTFNLKMSAVARLTTPLVPFMDNLYMDFHFFAVPNRLLWSHWVNFMGERVSPSDSTEYTVPCIDFSDTGFAPASIGDYMGLPPISFGTSLFVSALPFRAYNLIYNEWYRPQDLCNPVTVFTGDGPDAAAQYTLKKRAKRHDYFTSCLPWPQKGVGVELPLGSSAPVKTDATTGSYISVENSAGDFVRMRTDTDYLAFPGSHVLGLEANRLYADLSEATAATINSLREAFQLQRLLERDARGGTRYTELILSHFGVQSPDARLQRPEYLGGGTLPVQINSIPQTSVTSTTPQGHMAAYGYVNGHGIGFTKSFTEHCIILGLVSVRADLTYQQGVNRMWSRQTKYDYYWPALAHLGEQAVLSKEIYFGNQPADEDVFGYQEAWAEYRYKPSLITGKLRSTFYAPLDMWHLSQKFTSRPVLNANFIEEAPPVSRVVAVQTEPHFVFDSYFDLICARPMPMYSVPGLIDHF